ncbi:MAG: hypothetical protein U5K77_01060 [Candidatus Saccharibacteria bacterium]|nr:hypothetical protein [Candidatus Saccharibacteria bacterium]
MSEQLHERQEHSGEHIDTSAETKKLKEQLEAASEQKNNEKQPSTEKLAKQAESEAISGKERTIGEHKESSDTPIGQQKDIKYMAYKRTLSRVQSQLSVPEKTFSKFIHRPTIEKASEIGSKTVARPSGIMGGGVASLLGTGFVLFVAKRYGFEYNYMLFVLLFAAGFIIGIGFELIVRLLARQRNQ